MTTLQSRLQSASTPQLQQNQVLGYFDAMASLYCECT
jgi:hypothetical protein